VSLRWTCSRNVILSAFCVLTVLVRWQEGHLASKKPGVGLLLVMIWLELCTSCSSGCHHHLCHPCCNKIQNVDILIPTYPGCPGKQPLNECCCCYQYMQFAHYYYITFFNLLRPATAAATATAATTSTATA